MIKGFTSYVNRNKVDSKYKGLPRWHPGKESSHQGRRHKKLRLDPWPRGMVWGGKREESSGWGTHVNLWRIHFDIWQNQYNIVKLKNKIKLKKKKKKKRKKWQPTSVFLPGKFSGPRSLAGYSTWAAKESDLTEWLITHKRRPAEVISWIG